jgi:hypothetical protein
MANNRNEFLMGKGINIFAPENYFSLCKYKPLPKFEISPVGEITTLIRNVFNKRGYLYLEILQFFYLQKGLYPP